MPLRINTYLFKALFLFIFFIPTHRSSAQEEQAIKLKTVVIDPGHGGKHPGAISTDGKVKEKDLTLSISLKLGELIKKAYPDVTVIYTRTTDKYVDLIDRTKIANQNHADLFISIHINSVKERSANGTETFVMGVHKTNENFEVISRENSVIEIEDDYTSKYKDFDPNDPTSYIIFSLIQNSHLDHSLMFASLVQEKLGNSPFKVNRGVKQGGLWVLYRCTMPAVLVELGFISNTNDYRILADKSNHDKLAGQLLDAFIEYKTIYDKELEVAVKPANSTTASINSVSDNSKENRENKTEEKDGEKEEKKEEQNEGSEYRIQIFATSSILEKNNPNLKNLRNYEYVKSGNLYKYSVGPYKSYEEATKTLMDIRKRYPDAFIVIP